MEAWKAKGTAVALAAMGLVTTLVGMALVESAAAATAAGLSDVPLVGGGFAQIFGELATIAGAGMLIAAIFSYVLASRRDAVADPMANAPASDSR